MDIKVVVKYETNRAFKDKYTKQEIKCGDVLEIDIERMKELNERNAGRVVDILVEQPELSNPNYVDKGDKKKPETEKNKKEKFEENNVNKIKDLAEEIKIELTKAKKDEIIEEILQKQK